MPAEPGAEHRNNLIAWPERGHTLADGLDDAGNVHTEDPGPGAEDAEGQRRECLQSRGHFAAAGAVVGGAESTGHDLDEHLPWPR